MAFGGIGAVAFLGLGRREKRRRLQEEKSGRHA
jgi:hypothetical protein